MTQKFQRKIENFKCANCGQEVTGDGFTDHCPKCLWSCHVDNFPGDRLNSCGGLMKPINIILAKGKYQIIHQCQVCGETKKVKAFDEDEVGDFLQNMI